MNRLRRTRLYEIGLIERDFRLPSGLTGSSSRSAKISIDARFSGYEFYQCFDYPISIASHGDCPDRYLSRSNEIIEPSRIIYAIPYVSIQSGLKSILPSSATNCSSRIFITELLTTEFLIRFPPILSLINELKLSIESSKGIYPISIPSSPIIPSSIVSNDYSTSNQLNKFRRYINIGDPIAVLGPIDLVSGSVDLTRLCSACYLGLNGIPFSNPILFAKL